MAAPERGDLVYLSFNPQAGHEQAGRRPAIVLSPKNFNETTKFAVVCPITTVEKGYPFEVKLPEGLPFQGVILADQVKSLDWHARGFETKGQVTDEVVADCLELIHTFLS
ncbi:mRNA interferase MazF [Thermoactinomyces sp. DSM 45891]|uniref:type II toxin-antitoxin system PemK/MazF family toxin n=1 Tax=Thermoactinomyces sp. DSM 45891 TaxID=1761907 RepID=UPI00090EE738|nr:type II toxin-antitoxin system PemK/MazF family toxin [Thermoactinomyces sp. DSM 45891]SFX23329.1 mRNA interferase MazF [Thermoactinomyces sp. DSM 45891]